MSFREVFLILAFVLNLIQGYVTEDGPFTDSNAHVVSLFVVRILQYLFLHRP